MAAADAFGGLPSPVNGAIFFNGVDGVLATRRGEATLAAEQPAERGAVEQNQLDQ
jgi:hypothetical protein